MGSCGWCVCVCVEGKPKPKRRWKKKAPPSEQRRSARLEVKRQEMEQFLLTHEFSSDDGSLSDDGERFSSPSPKRFKCDVMHEGLDATLPAGDSSQPVHQPADSVDIHQVRFNGSSPLHFSVLSQYR